MSLMIAFLAAALSTTQETGPQDGWLVSRNQMRNVTSASAVFTNGMGVAVRCNDGALDAVILGLPEASTSYHHIQVLLDGRVVQSSWFRGGDRTSAFALRPSLFARRLRGAQTLSVRILPDSGPATRLDLPLPPSDDGLAEPMARCETPMTDARDDAVELGAVSPPRGGGPIDWVRNPTPTYPDSAMRANVRNGLVAMTCSVNAAGDLSDCQVDFETPADYGFGREALKATRKAKVSPGQSPDSPSALVSFVITFALSYG